MAKKMTGPRVLTANLLQDGIVVFLGRGGAWAPGIGRARLAHCDDEVAQLEALGGVAAEENLIVDPYFIEVEGVDSALAPVEFRERMRAAGPSVNLEFNSRTNGHAGTAGQAVTDQALAG